MPECQSCDSVNCLIVIATELLGCHRLFIGGQYFNLCATRFEKRVHGCESVILGHGHILLAVEARHL